MYSISKHSVVFDVFIIFKNCALLGVGSLNLICKFSCQLHHVAFGRLESPTLFPVPIAYSVNILLKFQCILYVLNLDYYHENNQLNQHRTEQLIK